MITEPQSMSTTDHFGLDHGYVFAASGVGHEIGAGTALDWLKRADTTSGEFGCGNGRCR